MCINCVYLPVFTLLAPALNTVAVVLADTVTSVVLSQDPGHTLGHARRK